MKRDSISKPCATETDRSAYERWPTSQAVRLTYASIEHRHGNRIQGVQALRDAKQRMGARFPQWAQELLDKQGR